METEQKFEPGDLVTHRDLLQKGIGKVIAVREAEYFRYFKERHYREVKREVKVNFEACTGWFLSEELVKQEGKPA